MANRPRILTFKKKDILISFIDKNGKKIEFDENPFQEACEKHGIELIRIKSLIFTIQFKIKDLEVKQK